MKRKTFLIQETKSNWHLWNVWDFTWHLPLGATNEPCEATSARPAVAGITAEFGRNLSEMKHLASVPSWEFSQNNLSLWQAWQFRDNTGREAHWYAATYFCWNTNNTANPNRVKRLKWTIGAWGHTLLQHKHDFQTLQHTRFLSLAHMITQERKIHREVAHMILNGTGSQQSNSNLTNLHISNFSALL